MSTPSAARSGVVYAFLAYGLWGLLPLYFLTLAPTGPWELVALRILLSLLVCAVLMLLTRSWRRFWALARRPRILLLFALAGALIWVNWTVYVLAALGNHVVEAALGYFMNPLVTIALGVILLRERLRPLQWCAVAIALLAVLVLTFAYGQIPVIGLVLAFSFGLYGYVKKQAGSQVDALSGLTLETLWLAPVAIVQLIWVAATAGLTLGGSGAGHAVLLSLAGIVTATPLLLFAAAARRIPLVYLGLIQFAAPILQFIIGVLVLHEEMPPERLLGFAIVWVACALLIVDALGQPRRNRRFAERAELGDETDPLADLEATEA